MRFGRTRGLGLGATSPGVPLALIVFRGFGVGLLGLPLGLGASGLLVCISGVTGEESSLVMVSEEEVLVMLSMLSPSMIVFLGDVTASPLGFGARDGFFGSGG